MLSKFFLDRPVFAWVIAIVMLSATFIDLIFIPLFFVVTSRMFKER